MKYAIRIIALILIFIIGNVGSSHAHEDAPHTANLIEEVVDTTTVDLPNAMCPVTIDEAVDPDIFEEYQGRKIYFCCKKCRKKFIEDPEAYLENLPPLPSIVGEADAHEHEAGAEQAHDHASHAGKEESNRLIEYVGRFHPLVIHFPIALIIITTLAEILFMVSGSELFSHTARFCVVMAAASTVVAVMLGLAAGSTASYPDQYASVLDTHRILGIVTGLLSILTAIASELGYRQKATSRIKVVYRALLFASAILVGLTGHLGATLIYGLDYFKF